MNKEVFRVTVEYELAWLGGRENRVQAIGKASQLPEHYEDPFIEVTRLAVASVSPKSPPQE